MIVGMVPVLMLVVAILVPMPVPVLIPSVDGGGGAVGSRPIFFR